MLSVMLSWGVVEQYIHILEKSSLSSKDTQATRESSRGRTERVQHSTRVSEDAMYDGCTGGDGDDDDDGDGEDDMNGKGTARIVVNDSEEEVTCGAMVAYVVRRTLTDPSTTQYSSSSGYSNNQHQHHRNSTSNSSSSSSSSSSSRGFSGSGGNSFGESEEVGMDEVDEVSWLASARAVEVVASTLLLGCCMHISEPYVSLAVGTLQSLSEVSVRINTHRCRNNAASHRRHTYTPSITDNPITKGRQKPAALRTSSVREGETSLVLSEILTAVYQIIPVCRRALLTSVLKGILCVSGVDTDNTMGTNANEWGHWSQPQSQSQSQHPSMPLQYGMQPSVSMLATDHPLRLQRHIMHVAHVLFHHTLNLLCLRYPHTIACMQTTLASYVPALAAMPVHALGHALIPLARLSQYTAECLEVILNMCRKTLLHRDLERKAFAIHMLVALLPVLHDQEAAQHQVVLSLVHAFSLPLPCRRVLYAQLVSFLTSSSLSSSSLLPSSSSSSSSSCRSTHKHNHTATTTTTDGGSDDVDADHMSLLSPRLIAMLRQKVSTWSPFWPPLSDPHCLTPTLRRYPLILPLSYSPSHTHPLKM